MKVKHKEKQQNNKKKKRLQNNNKSCSGKYLLEISYTIKREHPWKRTCHCSCPPKIVTCVFGYFLI